ncbi:hypothetical protein cypCar_00019887, partial [Cyprinus carpio]
MCITTDDSEGGGLLTLCGHRSPLAAACRADLDMLMNFTSTQLVAMTLEHKKPQIAWYSRFSRHPYYGKTAINSGVMLMNLTRMRITQFKIRKE